MRKILLFENVNGNSDEVKKLIWERYGKVGNVSIKFLPIKQWQKGLSLRVGGQPDNIKVFIKDLKKSGPFFKQLENENNKIFRVTAEEKKWIKIPI